MVHVRQLFICNVIHSLCIRWWKWKCQPATQPCKKVTHTSSLHETRCRLLKSVRVYACAHVTTLYLINVTDCWGGVGNVSKYARLNERSRGGIMGFHNTPLLLGMRVCIFGRRTRHIALSLSQIYTLTKDFMAACRQRAMESITRSLNRTETWPACLDPWAMLTARLSLLPNAPLPTGWTAITLPPGTTVHDWG